MTYDSFFLSFFVAAEPNALVIKFDFCFSKSTLKYPYVWKLLFWEIRVVRLSNPWHLDSRLETGGSDKKAGEDRLSE